MTLVIILGIIGLLLFPGILFMFANGKKSSSDQLISRMESEIKEREALFSEAKSVKSELVEFDILKETALQAIDARDAARLERGRVTITQAELETVETRLREIDEIERELEASNIETQEELKILQKKESALTAKNASLKEQLATTLGELDKVLKELESNVEVTEKISRMKDELVRTEIKIEELLEQIKSGNEQYFILKKRYDALDIEYAQLYEKFAEVEGE
jgi:chromosome segregation ATPase